MESTSLAKDMVGVPSDPDRARSNPYRASPIEIEPDRLHIGRNRIHIGPIKSRTNPNRAQSKPSRATAIQIQPKSHRIQAGLIESRSGHSNPEGIQIEWNRRRRAETHRHHRHRRRPHGFTSELLRQGSRTCTTWHSSRAFHRPLPCAPTRSRESSDSHPASPSTI